ncbi:hypothetical protein PR202_gb01038 [Eleusine coracana subsp. coracana]|uniref:At4g15545-like C-terminal domain-containing protein n=1 Tax=Eleusine coracana subsp. coracana TaxID=191504 RepID=A0AAV5DUX7_ELECO|nr:hypothetical protein PR202_gb01038 [Eleusine coracana subsp. coracana]
MAEEGEPAAAPLALTVGDDAGESAAAAANDFGLPAELVALLPADPFAQLDVARKITSMALAFRLGRVEAEAARLRAQLAERDAEAEDLRERVEQLDTALGVASARIRRAEEEKETLLTEKASLVNTVQKLNKDVAKLEVFKKTLMQSLQEDEDGHITAPKARVAEAPNFSPASSVADEGSAGSNSKVSQFSETASSVSDESRVDPDGRTRVDGKEFFRQVSAHLTSVCCYTCRNRLSYEQFSAFLANVKELNANRQTREETLRKADEIFGPENKDLYTIFGSLITRNIQ